MAQAAPEDIHVLGTDVGGGMEAIHVVAENLERGGGYKLIETTISGHLHELALGGEVDVILSKVLQDGEYVLRHIE